MVIFQGLTYERLIYSRFLEQLLSGQPSRENKIKDMKKLKNKPFLQSLTAENMVCALRKKLFETSNEGRKPESVANVSKRG